MIAKVLYVDDVRFDRVIFAKHFSAMRREDLQLACADSVESGLSTLQEQMPAVLFLDACVPPYDSFEQSLERFQDAGFDGPVIVVTGLPTDDQRRAVEGPGSVCGVLDKHGLNHRRLTEVMSPLMGSLDNR